MPILAFPCRKCGSPIDPGAKAALVGNRPNVVLDLACADCGHRALYPAALSPIATG